MGGRSLRLGSVSVDPEWGMRQEMMSRSCTARLDQIWICAV
ncbi:MULTISPECIES: DUF4113 domain-containing protein [Pseudomonas syringae group]